MSYFMLLAICWISGAIVTPIVLEMDKEDSFLTFVGVTTAIGFLFLKELGIL